MLGFGMENEFHVASVMFLVLSCSYRTENKRLFYCRQLPHFTTIYIPVDAIRLKSLFC